MYGTWGIHPIFGETAGAAPRPCLEPDSAFETLWGVSVHREQAYLDASLEDVWSLVGSPARYAEWWPRIVEVQGERYEEGDEYVQVVNTPRGKLQSHFLIERRDDLREIRMSCQLTGTYAEWLLTPAQGGTFVELKLGMSPTRLGPRIFDKAFGRRYFQAWTQQSLEALRAATAVLAEQPGDSAG